MRILAMIGLLLLLVAPARADWTWAESSGGYQLSAAALFRLRSEMAQPVQDGLKAIRNAPFADEAAFRAALATALPDDAARTQWTERLVGLAAKPGAAFGTEPHGPGVLSLVVTDAGRMLDDNAFTSQSWLAHLPVAGADAGVTTAVDGACLAVREAEALLFRLCRPAVNGDGARTVELETAATHVVGLGQEFQTAGDTQAERAGWVRHGSNVMSGFNGGANGNTLFPIAYFSGGARPFALILDNRYSQEWDFKAQPARLKVGGGDLRFLVLTGEKLADLRRRYMAMAGHPPVPPKQMFGLWLSEYGFENWAELDGKLATLKAAGFPLSGVVLDLFWFGGVQANQADTHMGTLSWDLTHFPDPAGKIKALAAEGIGAMLIEESYVGADLPEHEALAAHQALAHDANGVPLQTSPGNWWGKGGMIDWLNPDGAAFWHDYRRQALIDMGVIGHWTDLGEPEMVSPDFRYGTTNLTDAQARNSYNVMWAKSIFDGYSSTAPTKRPFILSRSGGMGIQAYGAAMWSGDTAGDFGSLAAQMPQQQHMMWSGLDYYGSDIGGFHRSGPGVSTAADAAMNTLYTQWLAYSAMFEVPVRPHTENLCNCKETAPDRIGDVASNLANLKLRYDLLPYYYSLAHAAWRDGEPVFPSLDYYYDDAAARGLGAEKMIGPNLLGAAVATAEAKSVPMHLPKGDWYDFRSGTLVNSVGETRDMPVYRAGRLELPLLARDGAIVPMADGVLRVFGSADGTFAWVDDDGISTAYQSGDYRETDVALSGDVLTLTPAKGAALAKTLMWTRAGAATRVRVNGTEVPFTMDGMTLTATLPDVSGPLRIEVE